MLKPAGIDSSQEPSLTECEPQKLESLVAERNVLQQSLANCRDELAEAQQQLYIERALTSSLQTKISELERELSQDSGELIEQIQYLSAEIADFEYYEHMSHRREQAILEREAHHCEERASMAIEIESLHERIRDQGLEVQMWKNEALSSQQAVGRSCCNTALEMQVAEAIIREREWMNQVNMRLQNEIEAIRDTKVSEIMENVGEDEMSSACSSPLVTSLRGEIALLKLGRNSLV